MTIANTRGMNRRAVTERLFFFYFVVLAWAIIYKFSLSLDLPSVLKYRSVNLIPIAGSFTESGSFCTAEFLFNIAAFVPFGIYLSATASGMSIRRRALIFFLISLGFETLQFILNIGVFDITDLLTNTLGGVLGINIFALVHRIFGRNCLKFINAAGLIGTTGVLAAVYAFSTGLVQYGTVNMVLNGSSGITVGKKCLNLQ